MNKMLVMNQPIQCTELARPIIFIASFNLFSFSYTIALQIMLTE